MIKHVVIGEDINAEFSELQEAEKFIKEIESQNGEAEILTRCETEDLPF